MTSADTDARLDKLTQNQWRAFLEHAARIIGRPLGVRSQFHQQATPEQLNEAIDRTLNISHERTN